LDTRRIGFSDYFLLSFRRGNVSIEINESGAMTYWKRERRFTPQGTRIRRKVRNGLTGGRQEIFNGLSRTPPKGLRGERLRRLADVVRRRAGVTRGAVNGEATQGYPVSFTRRIYARGGRRTFRVGRKAGRE